MIVYVFDTGIHTYAVSTETPYVDGRLSRGADKLTSIGCVPKKPDELSCSFLRNDNPVLNPGITKFALLR